MSFLTVINEALKSEREPDKSKKVELKVPQLDVPKWLENQTHGRETKFKKTPNNHLAMDPSDGFFFHYQPDDNLLYVSNGAFNFIVGRRPRDRVGSSSWRTAPHYYDLKRIEDDDYKVNDFNFRVDDKTKKINLEKDWGGSKGTSIVAGRVKRPEDVRDSLKAAIKHFPKLANYTFVPAKEKVSEYIKGGVAALEQGGTLTAYFAALGDEMKDILKDGLDDTTVPNKNNQNYKIQIHFDKKEATSAAKELYDSSRLYHVVAVASFAFSDPDLLEESYGDQYKIAEGKSVPAKDIKMVKTNLKDYFDKNWSPVKTLDKLKEDPLVKKWDSKWNHIFVARSDEEYDRFKAQRQIEKFTKRGRKKGPDAEWTWGSRYGDERKPVGYRLKNGPIILMFPPGFTKEDINKFLAKRWWDARDVKRDLDWQEEEKLVDPGYEIYFNHNFPDIVAYAVMKSAFEKKYSWRDSAVDMLNALGREVKRPNEDD